MTQPNLLESVVKASDRLADVRQCDYQLLGWEPDNHFFYREICGGTVHLWQYDLGGAGTRASVSAAPAALSREIISRDYLLAQLRAVGVLPQSVKPATRAVFLPTGQDNGYRSPYRRWGAVVVQHLYGPQDIVIVGQ